MTSPGSSPWQDRSVEDLLARSLRPGADHEPGLSPAQLGAGARRRAGQVRRRRSAAATAVGTGAVVALTLVVVPALRGAAAPDGPPPPPAASALPSPSLVAEPSAAPSAAPAPSAGPGPSALPSSGATAPVPSQDPRATAAVEPLELTPEGHLLVPDEVQPAAAALPGDLGAAVSSSAYPAGAFLQNLVPACTEASGPGSSGLPGGDFLGARTWTHPGEAGFPARSSADARVDLFAPGAATTALQVLADRARDCQQAGLGVVVGTGRGEDLPGADGYLLVTGTTPGVEGGPEVAVLPDASALVVVRVGDVLVRSYVTRSDEGVTDVDDDLVVRAEQLAALYLDGLASTGTAERLALSR